MLRRVLTRIRDNVRNHRYIVTSHGRKEMNDDELSIFDLEHVILTGEIVERQRDRATLELKYRVEGESLDGELLEVVVKISSTGMLVILTVYKL